MSTDPGQKVSQKQDKKEETMIMVSNLRKSFDSNVVLNDISFTLFKGENLVILGKSGTGKSVLVKCIVRLLEADGGSIDVLSNHVSSLNKKQLGELRKKIGFLFQSGALYDSMTVRENLEFPLIRIKKKMKKEERHQKVMDVLENVGLTSSIDKMPSELSGGMRKRISLARTIIVDPLIMLYDEPTTGLDPVTSDEISVLINDVRNKYKTSSIIITHDIECARATADRLILLHEGKIYKQGALNEFERSGDNLIRSFFKQ